MKLSQFTLTPSNRLFILIAFIACIGLGCFLWDEAALVWLILLVALIGALLWEAWMLLRFQAELNETVWRSQPTVQRPFLLEAKLKITGPDSLRYTIEAIDNDMLRASKNNAHLSFPDKETVHAVWEILSQQRGNLTWPGGYVHGRTRLGLLHLWRTIPPLEIPVYPKISRDIHNQLNPQLLMEQLGVKTNRIFKADQDFESLRPYVVGDNYRHIDWKASARMRNWITRQFQVEHHHNILVCLDSSRLMGTLSEGISKLDWAIEATMHLAFLASRFEDRIGLLVFSNEIERWVKPRNHPVEAFLSNVYNIQPKVVEADFNQVCANILHAQKKRSLVIFLSDFLDASSLEPSMPALAQLNRKHCSLFIGVEDPVYQQHLSDAMPENPLAVTRKIVAMDSMRRRLATLQQLKQLGLHTVTVSPNNLVQQAMAAYMEIKFKGAI